MLRASALRCGRSGPLPLHRDTEKSPRMMTEVGTWLYKRATMRAFQRWCRTRQVRAYGNVKMASTMQHARCLRVNDKEAFARDGESGGSSTVLQPGQAIITVPLSSCFNFLTVAHEMGNTPDSAFPLQLNWMNYNERLPFLKSTATFELAQAGWMARIASFAPAYEEGTEGPGDAADGGGGDDDDDYRKTFHPYMTYLLEDTRGRDGIAQGISREREEESGMVDHYLSEMATDACEDPETFLENLFRSLAALLKRSQPIEAEAVGSFLRAEVNFFKAKKAEMFVPTLMPLIDAVPQREDGQHNTVVEYFPYRDEEHLRSQLKELQIPFYEKDKPRAVRSAVSARTGQVEQIVNREHELMDPALLRGGGFFALRALCPLEAGDVLYVRQFPWQGGMSGHEDRLSAQLHEANRVMHYES